ANLSKIKQKEKAKEEAYYKNLDQRLEKQKEQHEEVEKTKEEWKQRSVIHHEYRFQKYEKDFLEKELKKSEDKKNDDMMKLRERKSLLRPINREELNEFSKKVDEDRQRLIFEKER